MLRRHGRLHAFETLEARRTALVVLDVTVLFAADANSAAVGVDNINQLAAVVRSCDGLVACVIRIRAPSADGTSAPV
jgi:hypothetical protein